MMMLNADLLNFVNVIIAVCVPLLTAMAGILIYVFKGVEKRVSVLPNIETDLVAIKADLKYGAEKQDEFCDRLERVETAVSNTERIAVMERMLSTLETEVKDLRRWRHDVNERRQEHALVHTAPIMGVSEPQRG
jgi:hypothetical protein